METTHNDERTRAPMGKFRVFVITHAGGRTEHTDHPNLKVAKETADEANRSRARSSVYDDRGECVYAPKSPSMVAVPAVAIPELSSVETIINGVRKWLPVEEAAYALHMGTLRTEFGAFALDKGANIPRALTDADRSRLLAKAEALGVTT